jgi:dolichol kinase
MKLSSSFSIGILISPWLIAATLAAVNFPFAPRVLPHHTSRVYSSSLDVNNHAAAKHALAYTLMQQRGGSTATSAPSNEDFTNELPSFSESDNEGHLEIAKKLKNRNATNLSRKITHAAFGIFFACLNQFIPHAKFMPLMYGITGSSLIVELLRYRKGFGWINTVLNFFLGGVLRKHEMEGKFTGSFYYFAGVTVSAYLFPQTAATMGICQLALADPSASFFGRRTRHIYWSRIEGQLGGIGRNKGLLGFLGGALFCFPFNYRVFKIAKWGAAGIPGGNGSLIMVSLLLGMAGAFADLAVPTPALVMPKKILGVPVPPFHVDDNFVVPIFSGWACTKIFEYVGWDQGLKLAEHIIL